MEAYLPLILTVIVLGSVAVIAAILLRLPVKTLDNSSRIAALETQLAEAQNKVNKALRRIGMEEKKAAKAAAESAPPQDDQFQLPFDQNGEPDEPLEYAARLARISRFAVNRRRN